MIDNLGKIPLRRFSDKVVAELLPVLCLLCDVQSIKLNHLKTFSAGRANKIERVIGRKYKTT